MIKRKENRDTESARLKKYEVVYNLIRDSEGKEERKKRKEKGREKDKKDRNKTPEVVLNEYQVFVKEESKKEKYRDLPGKERMKMIAEAWKRKKRKKK